MKVSELIEKLQELDPDTEVYGKDPGCGCCSDGITLAEEVRIGQVYKSLDTARLSDSAHVHSEPVDGVVLLEVW